MEANPEAFLANQCIIRVITDAALYRISMIVRDSLVHSIIGAGDARGSGRTVDWLLSSAKGYGLLTVVRLRN